ncbi:MAG: LysM peptidoglycan-binding domain-containing protein [Smithella sp.]|nr:LysM peptidoglycan-binding domain-containing protein [Smithella sp.]
MIKQYALAFIFGALFAVLVYQPANALESGQSLILPGKPIMETAAKPEVKTEAKVKEVKRKKTAFSRSKSTHKITSAKVRYYKIKKGDGLMEIIRRELRVAETDVPKTVNIIKSLNPRIKNVNKIHPGTVIKLPDRTVLAKTAAKTKAIEQNFSKLPPPTSI